MTGDQFKQRRKGLNHSISSASSKLGISSRTLCRWENLPELPLKIEQLTKRLTKRLTR
jgi:DNA-binding transcriptional regulator YiaG